MADTITRQKYVSYIQAGPQAVNAVLVAVRQGYEVNSIALCLAELDKAIRIVVDMKRAVMFVKNTVPKT